MLYSDQIKELLSYYEKILDWYSNKVFTSPEGILVFQKSHGYDQFLRLYWEGGRRIRQGITHNEKMLRALAQKEFARKALEILEPNVISLRNAIDQIIPFDPDEILKSMTKGYEKLPDDYFFDRDYIEIAMHLDGERTARIQSHRGWGEQPYEQTAYYEEYKVIRTSRGEWVRSKSEALILEQLYHDQIEVHYDEHLCMNGIEIAPDFTFEGRDGQPFFWEHIGMLDKPDYAKKNYDKLKRYYHAGLLPGDNLIVSFERHGIIDMNVIDDIIEH